MLLEGPLLGLRQFLATEKAYKNDEKCFLFHVRGRRQNVLGQLSGFWSLRFYLLSPPLSADHTQIYIYIYI